MANFTKGEWQRWNAPNGEHIWCGDTHIADIVTDTDNPGLDKNVNEIAKSAVLMHNDPKYRAAPDIYEALKDTVYELDRMLLDHHAQQAYLNGKAALAKARNEN